MGDFSATITALSTPPGESGLAVVRLSGDEACSIAGELFRTPSGERNTEWGHRRLYHGHIVSGNGDTIDEVVVGVFRGPESYTGEDVVEISCHGGMVSVARLLDALYAAGARPAEPGEFTKRAFLGGKMDLIQAEAVADVIHARSELQQRVAQRQLEGGLSEQIGGLADEMLGLLAEIEANIDFIEEGIDTLDMPASIALVERQIALLDSLLESAPLTRPFRDGYQVVIAGRVNAGKSRLFNRLAGENRAIVTDVPGTTRDVLREPVVLDGLLFVLQDTAGLRDAAGDRVEEIGMNLAADAVRSADVVLFVVDASEKPAPEVADRMGSLDNSRSILVLNKTDLPRSDEIHNIMRSIDGVSSVEVSAQTGDGLDELRRLLVETVGGEALSRMARERFVLNNRLVGLLHEARERAGVLRAGLSERRPLELLAAEARDVLGRYEEATGRKYTDELLDVIFSRFCLGK